jgi:hypothetical protein
MLLASVARVWFASLRKSASELLSSVAAFGGVSAVSDVRVKCPRTDCSRSMIDEKRHRGAVFKAQWNWHGVCYIDLESFVFPLDGEPP